MAKGCGAEVGNTVKYLNGLNRPVKRYTQTKGKQNEEHNHGTRGCCHYGRIWLY